jgi:hypothetical protein
MDASFRFRRGCFVEQQAVRRICAASSMNLLRRMETIMANVNATSSSGGSDAAIAKMEAAFDAAIEKSAKITEITTEKKTELDATKQRPQN